ncbi:MAG: hypothetical protein ACP5NX_03035 [Candidatus Bilamarchaeaceae archaeon]
MSGMEKCGWSGCRKGQASIELLTTFGIVLAFTVPVLFLVLTATQFGFEKQTLNEADASARTLAMGINDVYSQGLGARKEVMINLPRNTESVSLVRNTEGNKVSARDSYAVAVTIKYSSGETAFEYPTFANNVRFGKGGVTFTGDDGIRGATVFTIAYTDNGVEVNVKK